LEDAEEYIRPATTNGLAPPLITGK